MPKANKGSQKWLQILVNNYPRIINKCIDDEINWVSPIADDEYKEYKDEEALNKLGISLDNKPLLDFWPKGGQTWDALGKSDSGREYFVEAKSHIGEISVGGTGATAEDSVNLISKSLNEVKAFLTARIDVDWSHYYYQYCNRLAYLYLLRVLNSVDAYLVWIYFVNDYDMNGPSSVEEWNGAIKLLKTFLGLGKTKLDSYIKECFIDVKEIKSI